MKKINVAVTLTSALLVSFTAKATDFTLSDSAIMSLDDNEQFYYGSPLTSSIVSKQDIPGTGVEYNLHFTGTNWPDYIFNQLSDKYSGAGTLVGMNVGAYSNFSLTFTLVSIDGSSSGSQVLQVATMIGPFGDYWSAYHPEFMSFNGSYPSSTVSTISVTSNNISVIGFRVMLYPYGGWSVGPHDVNLIVGPASGAVQIPEPSSLSFLVLGALTLFGGMRLRRRPVISQQ